MSEINSNLKNLINLGPFEPKADQSYYILAAGNPNYALTANAYYSTKLQIQSQMSGFWQRKNKYCNGLTEKMSESSSQNKLVFQVFFSWRLSVGDLCRFSPEGDDQEEMHLEVIHLVEVPKTQKSARNVQKYGATEY